MLKPTFIAYLLLLLLCFAYGLRNYKRLPLSWRLLVQFLGVGLITEISGRVLTYIILNSFPVYHFYFLCSVVYYSLIYRYFLRSQGGWQWHIYLGAGLCMAVGLTEIFQVGHLMFFPSSGLIALSLFLISLALRFYWKMLHTPHTQSILKQSEFWFNSGTFAFYSITFFIFGFFKYFENLSPEILSIGSQIIRICNFILYGSYLITLILASKKMAHAR